jgi:hypothetical protein
MDKRPHIGYCHLIGAKGSSSKKRKKKMTTVETAKMIRAELKATFPTHKFSVRKSYFAVINIEYNGAPEIRAELDAIAIKYRGWSEFNTDYIWVNAYGKAVA